MSGKLSVKNIKSVAEGLSECEIVQKDLMEHRPKAGDNVKGGIIISYSTDTNKGLMCAKKRLGPTIFSYDTIKEAVIKTLISTSSGKENTNILLYYGSSQAAKTCEDYNAGGYDDWFLPTSSELIHHNNNQLKELMRNVWTSTGVESDAFDRAHSHSWEIIYLDDESEIAVESRYSTVEHFVLPVREFSIDL